MMTYLNSEKGLRRHENYWAITPAINVLDITSHEPQENLLRDAKIIEKANDILGLIANELNLRSQTQR